MTRWTTPILISLALSFFASQALALPQYQKRTGIFYGAGFGGGHIKADSEGAEGHVGYNFRVRIGGGVNEQLTLEAELGFSNASYTQNDAKVEDSTRTVGVGANLFVAKDLYFRVQGGIADTTSEIGPTSNDETGLFVAGGAGYEFFANAQLAIGVGVDFQHQIYDDMNVNALNFGVTANWY